MMRLETNAAYSNDFYNESLKAILKSRDAIMDARQKVEQYDVGDFLSAETMLCLEKAIIKVELALTSLQHSNKHWVSFLCIPEIPMRQILKYLSYEDKSNLRLSSQGHRDIVDNFDEEFKTIKIDCDSEIDTENYFNILKINKDIKIESIVFSEDGQKYVDYASDRLVALKGSVELIEYVQSSSDTSRIENITVTGCYLGLDSASILSSRICSFAINLKVLRLEYVSIGLLENEQFSLPHLEQLDLLNVSGCEGLASLLASCSHSLEQISWRFLDTNGWSDMPEYNLTCLQESEITLKRVEKICVEGLTNISGFFTMLKISSKSLKDLRLRDMDGHENADYLQVEFSLPRLESLYLEDCNPMYLTILTCSAPTLSSLSLLNMDLRSLDALTYDIPAIVKIELSYHFNPFIHSSVLSEHARACKNIIAKSAESIKKLNLKGIDVELEKFDLNFPKLKSMYFDHCHSKLKADIVNRSPCLNELLIDRFDETFFSSCVDNQGINKLALENCHLSDVGVNEVINSLSSKFSHEFKELVISNANFESSFPTFEVLEVTKLTMKKCQISEVHQLLNACSTTLEELEIIECHSKDLLDWKELKSMEVLRKLKIQFKYDLYEEDYEGYWKIIRSDGLQKLIYQSSNTLEILTMDFPKNKSLKEEFVSLKLDLPNLKILQIHPKPSKHPMRHINRQLPEDVIFWFFSINPLCGD